MLVTSCLVRFEFWNCFLLVHGKSDYDGFFLSELVKFINYVKVIWTTDSSWSGKLMDRVTELDLLVKQCKGPVTIMPVTQPTLMTNP